LATLLGLKQGHVWNWLKSGRVPAEQCIRIEAALNGEVRCEDLHDDIAWSVLRNGSPDPADRPAQEQEAA